MRVPRRPHVARLRLEEDRDGSPVEAVGACAENARASHRPTQRCASHRLLEYTPVRRARSRQVEPERVGASRFASDLGYAVSQEWPSSLRPIAADTNVLVYARRVETAWHHATVLRLVALAEGTERCDPPVLCLTGFPQLTPSEGVFRPPTSLEQAAALSCGIAEAPRYEVVRYGPRFLELLVGTARQARACGKPGLPGPSLASLARLTPTDGCWTLHFMTDHLADVDLRHPAYMCKPCPRTSVNHVSGLDTRGRGRKSGPALEVEAGFCNGLTWGQAFSPPRPGSACRPHWSHSFRASCRCPTCSPAAWAP